MEPNLAMTANAERSADNTVLQAQSFRSDHSVMGRFARFATNLPQLIDRFSANLTLTDFIKMGVPQAKRL